MKAASQMDEPRMSALDSSRNHVPTRLPSICMHVQNTVTDDVRVMREAETLIAAGHNVTIVGFGKARWARQETTSAGVRVVRKRFPSWFVSSRPKIMFLPKLLWATVSAIPSLVRVGADIYHAHDVEALPATYIAARLRRSALVLDSHELPFAEPIYNRWKRLTSVSSSIARFLIRRCDVIFTVSPPIAREIEETYRCVPVRCLRNVPRYVAVSHGRRFHERLGLSPETKVVLYQGLLWAGRGLEELIEATPYLSPQTTVVIMGSGPIKESIETMVRERVLEERVRFLPPVPYKELLQWTSSADVGMVAYPTEHSKNEQYCLPNKFFEYVMSGLPVVTTRLDAIQEIVERYEIGRVLTSLAPQNLAAAINTLLADDVGRERMRANALAAVQSTINWEVESRILLGAYDELMLKRSRRVRGR